MTGSGRGPDKERRRRLTRERVRRCRERKRKGDTQTQDDNHVDDYVPPSKRARCGRGEKEDSDEEEGHVRHVPGPSDGRLPPLLQSAIAAMPTHDLEVGFVSDADLHNYSSEDSGQSGGEQEQEQRQDQEPLLRQESQVQPGEENPSLESPVVSDEDEATVGKVASFLSKMKYKHRVSETAVRCLYDFFCRDKTESEKIHRVVAKGGFPSRSTLLRRQEQSIPTVFLDIYEEGDDKTTKVTRRVKQLPRHLILNSQLLQKFCAYVDLEDLVAFFKSLHGNDQVVDYSRVVVSCDGVERSKHGVRTFYQISLCFPGCKCPIPWIVWEFDAAHKPSLEDYFRPVVEALERTGILLDSMVLDGKEQNFVRGMGATNCYYGCARCLSRGTKKKFPTVHYPVSQMDRTPKTTEMFRSLLKDNPQYFTTSALEATRELRKGVFRYSPLLDLEYFDLVNDIPLDALHLLHIGITKKTWERIFEPGGCYSDARKRREILEKLNDIHKDTKVVTEMRHKTGDIHPPHMKGSNWQTIDMFCLPAFVKHMELTSGHGRINVDRMRSMLLRYTFMIRAYYHADNDLARISSRINLVKNDETFVKEYGRVFNQGCLTFNMHQIIHLNQSRQQHGPLATHTTALYESMYAKTRYCYVGHTANAPKQLLQNFLAYQQGHHKCRKFTAIHFSTRATAKTDDTIAWYNQDFYKVVDKTEKELRLQRIRTRAFNTSNLVKLPWAEVGVRVYVEVTTEPPITVPKKDVKAKGVRCGDLVSTVYPEWLVT